MLATRLLNTSLHLEHCSSVIKRFLSIKVGQNASLSRTISPEDVRLFAELSGDNNPVHSGPHAVVHGAFLNSLVSCVMGTQVPGPGTMVVSQSLRYPNPCLVGDTVIVKVTVTAAKADLIKCSYTATAQTGDNTLSERPVLIGEASLITKENQQKRAAKHKTL